MSYLHSAWSKSTKDAILWTEMLVLCICKQNKTPHLNGVSQYWYIIPYCWMLQSDRNKQFSLAVAGWWDGSAPTAYKAELVRWLVRADMCDIILDCSVDN